MRARLPRFVCACSVALGLSCLTMAPLASGCSSSRPANRSSADSVAANADAASRPSHTGEGFVDTSRGLPPSIDPDNPPGSNGPARTMRGGRSATTEPVVIYNEAHDKLPRLFVGLQDAITRYGFRTIEIPPGRVLEPRIDDRGRTWIRTELIHSRDPLVNDIASWMHRAVHHLATKDQLAEVRENRMMDELAARLDVGRMGEAEGREVGRLAAAQAVVLIELSSRFTADRPINMYASRYVVKADYEATARMVDVERGVSVWFNTVRWSRAFEISSR